MEKVLGHFSFQTIGQSVFDLGYRIKEIFILCYLSFRNAIIVKNSHEHYSHLKTIIEVLISQVYFTGVMALPLIGFVALTTGTLSVMGATDQLTQYGQTDLIGKVLVAVVLREVSPLFTAMIVIARSGTAVATELGNMQVNREIQALEVMGIDYHSYVIFPRILGGVLSLIGLVFYFNVVALIGGYLMSSLGQPISFSVYADSLISHTSLLDISLIVIKNILAGFVIFTICSYMGLSVRKSSHEVPQVTTKAVVYSITGVMLSNIMVTTIYYLV
jgi:phospholipid/cholesterol/gamma-HCH transport system permease protein